MEDMLLLLGEYHTSTMQPFHVRWQLSCQLQAVFIVLVSSKGLNKYTGNLPWGMKFSMCFQLLLM